MTSLTKRIRMPTRQSKDEVNKFQDLSDAELRSLMLMHSIPGAFTASTRPAIIRRLVEIGAKPIADKKLRETHEVKPLWMRPTTTRSSTGSPEMLRSSGCDRPGALFRTGSHSPTTRRSGVTDPNNGIRRTPTGAFSGTKSQMKLNPSMIPHWQTLDKTRIIKLSDRELQDILRSLAETENLDPRIPGVISPITSKTRTTAERKLFEFITEGKGVAPREQDPLSGDERNSGSNTSSFRSSLDGHSSLGVRSSLGGPPSLRSSLLSGARHPKLHDSRDGASSAPLGSPRGSPRGSADPVRLTRNLRQRSSGDGSVGASSSASCSPRGSDEPVMPLSKPWRKLDLGDIRAMSDAQLQHTLQHVAEERSLDSSTPGLNGPITKHIRKAAERELYAQVLCGNSGKPMFAAPRGCKPRSALARASITAMDVE
eukprot:Clim_evm24s172 gene=Clim_evmTU24s172